MPDATIHARGEIVKRLGEKFYRASLPNGKLVTAHLSKGLAMRAAEFTEGDQVRLELTTFDFEQARILGLFSDAEGAEDYAE